MTKYINCRTSEGVETLDQFNQQEEGLTRRKFLDYVREMLNEYRLSGVDAYISSRATKEWRNS